MEHGSRGNPEMAIESSEAREASRRKAERAFATLVEAKYGEWDLETDRDAEVWKACERVLEEELQKKLGAKYSLSKEGEFSLAQGPRVSPDEFDPMEELAVTWRAGVDLAAGQVIFDYAASGRSKEGDWRNQRFFYTPVIEDTHFAVDVAPEAVERAYERLEAAHARRSAEREAYNVQYDALAAWAKQNGQRRLGREAW